MVTLSNRRAYVLVMVLLFLVIIQGLVMVTAEVVRYSLISSAAFRNILNEPDELSLVQNGGTRTLPCAPEGWDHTCFFTEVETRGSGESIRMQTLRWRAVAGQQPHEYIPEIHLAAMDPYIMVLVDDSESFGWSSGRFYDELGIYVKRASGDIFPTSFDLGGQDSVEVGGDTYFRGAYGNLNLRAPFSDFYGGAMPSATYYYPLLARLIDEIDLCEIAISTTSRGQVLPFTHDRSAIAAALEDLHLGTGESRLSELLHQSLATFPEECVTDKHMLYVTDGLAVDDGDLPPQVQDFDHDANPLDCYYAGMGSHCLDDVSAYAASRAIQVHTLGPQNDLLLQAAQKGTGAYLPTPERFMREAPFISQMPLAWGDGFVFLTNTFGRFAPSWLVTENAQYYTIDTSSLQLVPVASFTPAGPAAGSVVDGATLYLTTTRNCLLAIDLATRRLKWVIKGVGGRICARDGIVLAGPNADGRVVCLRSGPDLRWVYPGQILEMSGSGVYVASGNRIVCIDIQSGIAMYTFGTDEAVSTLRYDPCQGVLIAGTAGGTIHLLTQDLIRFASLQTGTGEEITYLRSFHHRKQPLIVALSPHRLLVAGTDGLRWTVPITTGLPIQAVVMDSKLYLTIWQEGLGCGGIDTGVSTLQIYDAPTGALLSQEQLLPGRAFGPLIDLDHGRIVYANASMATRLVDISALAGARWCSLGTRLALP